MAETEGDQGALHALEAPIRKGISKGKLLLPEGYTCCSSCGELPRCTINGGRRVRGEETPCDQEESDCTAEARRHRVDVEEH